jgi:uncharacterized protein (DUF2147 family)
MRVALVTMAASVGLLSAAAEASPEMMAGVWQRGDGLAKVRINRCGSSICAVNTWVKDPSGGEKVGDRLVMSVTPKAAGKMAGTAFDPQRKLSYRIEINVANERMKTRGCVLGGIVCKSVGWTKVN